MTPPVHPRPFILSLSQDERTGDERVAYRIR